MAKPKVTKSQLAGRDLFNIWQYIAKDSDTRADNFVDSIDEVFLALAANPELGKLRSELAAGLRSIPIGGYIIFYFTEYGVDIVRVLHSGRDVDVVFFHDI